MKKAVSMCLAMALSVSLLMTGCTSKADEKAVTPVVEDKATPEAPKATETAPEAPAKSEGKTVSSFVDTLRESGELDAMTNTGGEGVVMEIDATDDTLMYIATFTEELPGTIEELKTQLEGAATNFEAVYSTIAKAIADELGRDTVNVTVTYNTKDGTEIVTFSYSNK